MTDKYILFWSTYNEKDLTLADWRNRKVDFSRFHILPMFSHIALKNETYIYTYQNIDKTPIPKGITLKDANEILPDFAAFTALKKGHSIAHISDAVRLKVASQVNGIVIDMDAVMLRKFNIEGSFFSSMPAKMTGGFAPKWGESHPPITVHDKSWDGKALCAFPLKVSSSTSNAIEGLAHRIMINLKEEPNKGWNYILWTIKKIIKTDLKSVVFPPIKCCPVPAWLRGGKCYSIEKNNRLDGKTKLFGYQLPSIDNIIENSFVVQHFFESAFSKSEKVNDDFWTYLASSTLLAKEAEYVLGKAWGTKINLYIKSIEKINEQNRTA